MILIGCPSQRDIYLNLYKDVITCRLYGEWGNNELLVITVCMNMMNEILTYVMGRPFYGVQLSINYFVTLKMSDIVR